MIRLLCDAIPFCYGPAAALQVVLEDLLVVAPVLQIHVLATGSTKELLSRSRLPIQLLEVDSENPSSLATLEINRYDAFINVCNPISYETLEGARLPTIYVDFLLCMHDGKPSKEFDANLYLAENYPATEEWIKDHPVLVQNLAVIPPLIRTIDRRPVKGRLMVGLGGLVSRLTIPGRNTNYATFVTRLLTEVLPSTRFDEVIIASGEPALESLKAVTSHLSNITCVSLPHNEFLHILGSCEVFLSHPGLYAPFEAMIAGVPTGFLPLLITPKSFSFGTFDHMALQFGATLGTTLTCCLFRVDFQKH